VGDFSNPRSGEALASRSSDEELSRLQWTWLRQVHGAEVVVVKRPRDSCGSRADAAVTASAGAGLVVLTADCAPVALSSLEGVVGIAHAGWRGLLGGVVEEAVSAMRRLGASQVFAALGPCIHAHAYAFSPEDLEPLVARLGPGVRGVDENEGPALDLPAAVAAALARAGAELFAVAGTCTHCSQEHWSWRARRESGRQATVVWKPVAT